MIVSSICRILVIVTVGYFVMTVFKTYHQSPDTVGVIFIAGSLCVAVITLARSAHASLVEQLLKQLVEKNKEPEFDLTVRTDEWNL